jgi:hypothetical protein
MHSDSWIQNSLQNLLHIIKMPRTVALCRIWQQQQECASVHLSIFRRVQWPTMTTMTYLFLQWLHSPIEWVQYNLNEYNTMSTIQWLQYNYYNTMTTIQWLQYNDYNDQIQWLQCLQWADTMSWNAYNAQVQSCTLNSGQVRYEILSAIDQHSTIAEHTGSHSTWALYVCNITPCTHIHTKPIYFPVFSAVLGALQEAASGQKIL